MSKSTTKANVCPRAASPPAPPSPARERGAGGVRSAGRTTPLWTGCGSSRRCNRPPNTGHAPQQDPCLGFRDPPTGFARGGGRDTERAASRMSDLTYAVHTATCTYLLDEDGICRWTHVPTGHDGGPPQTP